MLRYAARLGPGGAAFDQDQTSSGVVERIRRDMDSALAAGQVPGTPTLFFGGVAHRGGNDPATLLAPLGT